MKHARPLAFDALESRKLLSAARVVAPRAAAHVPARTPVALNGTLTADPRAQTSTMNLDGSVTVTIPVSGQLGTLGAVKGSWNQTVDQYGDSQGPGTLLVRNGQGSVGIALNNAGVARPHKNADGTVSYTYPQRVVLGTGAYARATESGWVVTTTNAAKTGVQTLSFT